MIQNILNSLFTDLVRRVWANVVSCCKDNDYSERNSSEVMSHNDMKEKLNAKIEQARYKVDAYIFDVLNFEDCYEGKIKAALNNGAEIRLLVVDPNAKVFQKKALVGIMGKQPEQSIQQLVLWIAKFNDHYTNKIFIKKSKKLPMEEYWRVDDDLFITPMKACNPIDYSVATYHRRNRQILVIYEKEFDKIWNEAEEIIAPKNKK